MRSDWQVQKGRVCIPLQLPKHNPRSSFGRSGPLNSEGLSWGGGGKVMGLYCPAGMACACKRPQKDFSVVHATPASPRWRFQIDFDAPGKGNRQLTAKKAVTHPSPGTNPPAQGIGGVGMVAG